MSPQISVYVLNKQRVLQPLFQWLELRYYDALSPGLKKHLSTLRLESARILSPLFLGPE